MKYTTVLIALVALLCVGSTIAGRPCENVLFGSIAPRLNSFISQHWFTKDTTFMNCRIYNCDAAQRRLALTEYVTTFFAEDANIQLFPFNVTGHVDIINTFLSIAPYNGGESRVSSPDILSCTTVLKYHSIRSTLAVTLPTYNFAPLNVMNFIPSYSSMDISYRPEFDDFKITKLIYDQRGLYFLSTLRSPSSPTGANVTWAPASVGPLLVPFSP